MSSAIDKLWGAAGAVAIAAIASSANLLDNLTQRSGLNATVLLLITLALVIVVILAVMATVAWLSMQEVNDADNAPYRTICKSTMAHDIKRARSTVPDAPGRRHKTISRSDEFSATAAAVRAAGVRAADLEFDHGTKSINPHKAPSREARLMERHAMRVGAEQAVHTRTHMEA